MSFFVFYQSLVRPASGQLFKELIEEFVFDDLPANSVTLQ